VQRSWSQVGEQAAASAIYGDGKPRREIEERELHAPAPAADPAGSVGRRRQEHEQQHQQPGPGRGVQP
jgi:hypothetical protein